MNSQSNLPRLILSPSVTTRWETFRSWCSRSFSDSSASVSFDPMSGMSRSLPQQVRHSADMVLVAVGEHQADHIAQTLTDGVEARQDQVDARMIILRKQHSAVDRAAAGRRISIDGHVASRHRRDHQATTTRIVFGASKGGICKLLAATGRESGSTARIASRP